VAIAIDPASSLRDIEPPVGSTSDQRGEFGNHADPHRSRDDHEADQTDRLVELIVAYAPPIAIRSRSIVSDIG